MQKDRHARRFPRLIRLIGVGCAFVLLLLLSSRPGQAGPMERARAAYQSGKYVEAARMSIPLAEAGYAEAQTILGFLFSTGRGVPQNQTLAAYWYKRAATQGNPNAQYFLGLLYDKGQGVPRDVVEAYKWLNLAAGASSRDEHEQRARLRDAIATKMTRGEIADARRRSIFWAPRRER